MAAEALFLDSNGWVALLNAREALHARATSMWLELGRARRLIVSTDWVMTETGNGLARTTSRRGFTQGVRRLLGNPDVRIIQVNPDLRARALQLYEERPDKQWGLVDCASFVVMADEGIKEAFTTDRHFEQAGFTCLLPASGD